MPERPYSLHPHKLLCSETEKTHVLVANLASEGRVWPATQLLSVFGGVRTDTQ